MKRSLLLLVFALVSSGGCGVVDPGPLQDQQRRLDQAMARWEEAGPATYGMVYRRMCFCGLEVTRPVELRVQDGQVQERRYENREEAVPEPLAHLFLPVHEIFAEIQEAIDERAVELQVEYDPVLGFPKDVFIDRDRQIADEEVGHRVLEFEPLEPNENGR